MTTTVQPPATRSPGSSTPAAQRRRKRLRRIPWWFIVPAAAIYIFAVLWPSAQGATFAFTDWDGFSPERNFVGFSNFTRLFNDEAAIGAVWHTIFIALAVTIIQNIIGLLLALAVNARIKSRNVLRVAFFAPVIITPVATGYLWQFLLAPEGAVNSFLGAIGLSGLQQSWLGNSDLALWSVITVVVWQFTGQSMVIYLAGLQGVPEEVLEAASVDGAGPARKFWSIVRPELAPAITINLMLSVIGSLKLFDQIYVMTGGGPGASTETLSTMIYKSTFVFNEYGYGTAMALVLTFFVAILSTGQFAALRRQNGGK